MFRTAPLSIIRSFSLYTQQWYMSYRFADSLRAGSGRNFEKLMHLFGFIIPNMKQRFQSDTTYITNLLQNFLLLIIAATCFGRTGRPSSGRSEVYRRVQLTF